MIMHQPQVWAPILHIINTNASQAAHPQEQAYDKLIECPCTPQRKIDVAHNTIDGAPPKPSIHCSEEFLKSHPGNPSCNISTYIGGWRCCEHGVFLMDTDKECTSPTCSEKIPDEVYVKLTFYYKDAKPTSRNIESSACCDVTSVVQGTYNKEYDILPCPPGTPAAECLDVAETVQPVGRFATHWSSPNSQYKASDLVDLVFAAPHMHTAGLALELYDNVTGELIAEVHRNEDGSAGVTYGTGNEPGNEKGYLIGLKTFSWSGDTALRFRRDHPLRARATYNASELHTGVMSLWLMSVSPVEEDDMFV
jgi:hypothetical protein